jgi:hypothetical protein
MHRSSSVSRLGQLPQYNSSASRPPALYGHNQLPFNHHLQHQQQPQMARSGMIGQGQGPGHLSILSGQSGQLSSFPSQFLSQQVTSLILSQFIFFYLFFIFFNLNLILILDIYSLDGSTKW